MQIVLGYWPFRQPTVSVTAGGNFQWNFPPHQRWMRLHLDDFSTSLTPTLEIVDECRGLYTATAKNTLTFLGWISLKICIILFVINIYPREVLLTFSPKKHAFSPTEGEKNIPPTNLFRASRVRRMSTLSVSQNKFGVTQKS